MWNSDDLNFSGNRKLATFLSMASAARVTHRRYLFVGPASLVRFGSAILDCMAARRKKRSVSEDATALREALNVHCTHITADDKCQVAAKALLNSLINEYSSMEEIVKHVLPSPSKRTRRLGLTRRTHQR